MKSNNIYRLLFLGFATAALNSCSTVSVPKNEFQNLPSLVEIMVLDWPESNLKIRLTHRNETTRLNNQLNCQLALKDLPSVQLKPANLPDMSSYAVETINLKFASEAINQMPENDVIPYVLECFLGSSNFQREHLIKRSTLYLVPGSQQVYR